MQPNETSLVLADAAKPVGNALQQSIHKIGKERGKISSKMFPTQCMGQNQRGVKWRDEFELFCKIWEEWGLAGLPNTFVEAGVCRPNLLCEMEAIVIVPKER